MVGSHLWTLCTHCGCWLIVGGKWVSFVHGVIIGGWGWLLGSLLFTLGHSGGLLAWVIILGGCGMTVGLWHDSGVIVGTCCLGKS